MSIRSSLSLKLSNENSHSAGLAGAISLAYDPAYHSAEFLITRQRMLSFIDDEKKSLNSISVSQVGQLGILVNSSISGVD